MVLTYKYFDDENEIQLWKQDFQKNNIIFLFE